MSLRRRGLPGAGGSGPAAPPPRGESPRFFALEAFWVVAGAFVRVLACEWKSKRDPADSGFRCGGFSSPSSSSSGGAARSSPPAPAAGSPGCSPSRQAQAGSLELQGSNQEFIMLEGAASLLALPNAIWRHCSAVRIRSIVKIGSGVGGESKRRRDKHCSAFEKHKVPFQLLAAASYTSLQGE